MLVDQIRVVWDGSDETHGADKVHGQLRRDGLIVALRTFAELMGEAGMAGLSGRERTTTTTRRDRLEAPLPDLVERNIQSAVRTTPGTATSPTSMSWAEFWYLATVMNGSTKEVLGWAFADHMRTELISDAMHRAVSRRNGRTPAGVIFHSDRSSQYTSADFGVVCDIYQIRRSMARRDIYHNNADAESFLSILKRQSPPVSLE